MISAHPPYVFLWNEDAKPLGIIPHRREESCFAFLTDPEQLTWKPEILVSTHRQLATFHERNAWNEPRRIPAPRQSLVVVEDWRDSAHSLVNLLKDLVSIQLNRISVFRFPEDRQESFFSRLVHILDSTDPGGKILAAEWEGKDLVVHSGELKRLRVSKEVLARALRTLDLSQIDRFELDSKGSFLYWPELDAHVGWEQLEQTVHPKKKLEALGASLGFARKNGAAIRTVRERAGLRQKDIPGLEERQVRRIEKGEVRPTLAALKKLAVGHRKSLDDYLDELARNH